MKKHDLTEIVDLIGEQRLKAIVDRIARYLDTPSQKTHNAVAVGFGFETWQALRARRAAPAQSHESCTDMVFGKAPELAAARPAGQERPSLESWESARISRDGDTLTLDLRGIVTTGARDTEILHHLTQVAVERFCETPLVTTLEVIGSDRNYFQHVTFQRNYTLLHGTQMLSEQGWEHLLTVDAAPAAQVVSEIASATVAWLGDDRKYRRLTLVKQRDATNRDAAAPAASFDGDCLTLDLTGARPTERQHEISDAVERFMANPALTRLTVLASYDFIDNPRHWEAFATRDGEDLITPAGWEYLLADCSVPQHERSPLIAEARREGDRKTVNRVTFAKRTEQIRELGLLTVTADDYLSLNLTDVACGAMAGYLTRIATRRLAGDATVRGLAVTIPRKSNWKSNLWRALTIDGRTTLVSTAGWSRLQKHGDTLPKQRPDWLSSVSLTPGGESDLLVLVKTAAAAPTTPARLAISGSQATLDLHGLDKTADLLVTEIAGACREFMARSEVLSLTVSAPIEVFEQVRLWQYYSDAPDGHLTSRENWIYSKTPDGCLVSPSGWEYLIASGSAAELTLDERIASASYTEEGRDATVVFTKK